MTNPGFHAEEVTSISVEQRLQGAANFMLSKDIDALRAIGTLDDDRSVEGIIFRGADEVAVGLVLFSEGRPIEIGADELQRRLAVPGFINEVVRPVLRAATVVYREGSDLLDERFNVLPGFEDNPTVIGS